MKAHSEVAVSPIPRMKPSTCRSIVVRIPVHAWDGRQHRPCPIDWDRKALARAARPVAMEPTLNDLGQPIGFPLPGWAPPPAPPREPMEGRFCRLEPLDPDRHAADLFAANAADADGRSWTYLAYGPFRTLSDYRAWMGATCLGDDPLFFAIIDKADGKAGGRRELPPDHPGRRLDRGGPHPLLPAPAAEPGRHRGDVPDDEAGVRARLPAVRVEVRRAERGLPCGGPAPGAVVRGGLPAGDGVQGPQPRHGLVRRHRRRVAGAARRVPGVARPRQLRRRGPAANPADRFDAGRSSSGAGEAAQHPDWAGGFHATDSLLGGDESGRLHRRAQGRGRLDHHGPGHRLRRHLRPVRHGPHRTPDVRGDGARARRSRARCPA